MEKLTSTTLDSLLRDNYLTPLGLSDIALAPQDTTSALDISHPHVYPNTQLTLAGDGITPIDVTTVISDFIDLIGKSSWAAGGMLGNARDTAIWGYNLYSIKGPQSLNAVRVEMYDSVAEITSDDISPFGFGVKKIFYEDTTFFGYYGRSIGSENLMFYNAEIDTCFVILTSSNQRKNGNPNIDDLLFSLYEAVKTDA